jgi:hypothetical protein
MYLQIRIRTYTYIINRVNIFRFYQITKTVLSKWLKVDENSILLLSFKIILFLSILSINLTILTALEKILMIVVQYVNFIRRSWLFQVHARNKGKLHFGECNNSWRIHR